jgi:hypothetical protein
MLMHSNGKDLQNRVKKWKSGLPATGDAISFFRQLLVVQTAEMLKIFFDHHRHQTPKRNCWLPL